MADKFYFSGFVQLLQKVFGKLLELEMLQRLHVIKVVLLWLTGGAAQAVQSLSHDQSGPESLALLWETALGYLQQCLCMALCASLMFVPQPGPSGFAGGGPWARPFYLFDF